MTRKREELIKENAVVRKVVESYTEKEGENDSKKT